MKVSLLGKNIKELKLFLENEFINDKWFYIKMKGGWVLMLVVKWKKLKKKNFFIKSND